MPKHILLKFHQVSQASLEQPLTLGEALQQEDSTRGRSPEPHTFALVGRSNRLQLVFTRPNRAPMRLKSSPIHPNPNPSRSFSTPHCACLVAERTFTKRVRQIKDLHSPPQLLKAGFLSSSYL